MYSSSNIQLSSAAPGRSFLNSLQTPGETSDKDYELHFWALVRIRILLARFCIFYALFQVVPILKIWEK